MYSVYIFLFVLAVQTDGFTLDQVQCNYVYSQKCLGYNNYNIVDYNASVINYCTIEDVPSEINFTVILDEVEGEVLTDVLKIDFIPPKTECRYGVALLANPLIKNERECAEYKFQEVTDINSDIHTVEKTICVLINRNQLVRYNDNSTVSLCEDNIALWFQYIFTGCYALRFHVGRQEYVIQGHKFLNTTYQRIEVTEPQFTCKYDTYFNHDESHEIISFTLDSSLSADTGLLLKMALISEQNKNLQQPCIWHGESPMYTWTVNLVMFSQFQIYQVNKGLEERNCSINLVKIRTVSGKYVKTIKCNFQMQTMQAASYCFVFRLIDERCHKNTSWKPPVNGRIPCTWIKRCMRTFENSSHVEKTNMIKSDKLLSTSSYLLLPIIAIVLIVSAIIGALCFTHYLRIRNEEVNIYVNPHQDDFMNRTSLKSADFGIIDNNESEKRIGHDNVTCNDIVLLYTKGSTSFMALMEDFRETLIKICSCSVHDWHDGIEWNDVAKVGAVLWFSGLFNNGCRIVWIDTPATRSVIISNSKKDDSNSRKVNKYYEIGDFRDVAFPTVLELAKCNMKATPQYRRHFVARFEGLESPENIYDPFLDLSPHARYLMPQHLMQLCSHLSEIKPIISQHEINAEEDLLQHRLRFMKMESIM